MYDDIGFGLVGLPLTAGLYDDVLIISHTQSPPSQQAVLLELHISLVRIAGIMFTLSQRIVLTEIHL